MQDEPTKPELKVLGGEEAEESQPELASEDYKMFKFSVPDLLFRSGLTNAEISEEILKYLEIAGVDTKRPFEKIREEKSPMRASTIFFIKQRTSEAIEDEKKKLREQKKIKKQEEKAKAKQAKMVMGGGKRKIRFKKSYGEDVQTDNE